MRLLGAIIAGGGSTRFGDDKGAAMIAGRALIDHVVAALAPQVDALVICGRIWRRLETLADRPAPDLGPLGGLCAALQHAAAHGFDAVLSAGCDVLPLPDLRMLVGADAKVIEGQRLLGFWPASLSKMLDTHLVEQDDRSIRRWIELCGARSVRCEIPLHNLNTPEDLARYDAAAGLTS